MSSRKVLDSFCLVAFFEKEPGSEKMAEMFQEARNRNSPLLLCLVNWGEVYYTLRREYGKDDADRAVQVMDALPIEIVPADRELTLAAAEIKAAHRMSYADAFAAALAQTRKATLVTGDKEFKTIEGKVKVEWL